MFQRALKVLESGAGAILLLSLAGDIASDGAISRRAFLKGFGKGAAGLWLTSHIPEGFANMVGGARINEESSLRMVKRFLADINERAHPETAVVIRTFRNYLLAQKMSTIAERIASGGGRKPEVALAIGGAHVGIERALQKERRERLEVIDRVLGIPGLEETRQHLAMIMRADYDSVGDKWRVTETWKDPALAPMEAGR